ncbi:MAG: hypothetical protein ABSB66_04610 [Candidatus Acidiferrales bacterium]|jgi:hypothetical protein
MFKRFPNRAGRIRKTFARPLVTCALLVMAIVICDYQTASAAPTSKVMAIPAFARKYGLPCSACHTAWPELNNFGMVFRDNGYQLMNDRDSPIWQNPAYFPITFRITPNWHREQTGNQPVDSIPGGGPGSFLVSRNVTQAGFDLSGMDLWSAGTLFKNISFLLLPSSDPTAVWHFESAWVRIDNIKGSSWLNFKFGRFELDNLISEKRFLFLSANGGLYQVYHFNVPGSINDFGIGDNQIGLELAGHNSNSYTRYSVALLSSNEGGVNLTNSVTPGGNPSSRSFDGYMSFSQAFNAGSLGLERIQAYAYVGQRPTFYQTSTQGGVTTQLVGLGNEPFYRIGVAGELHFKNLEILPYFMHGHDSAYLAAGVPDNVPLPMGAHAPSFNGGFVEGQYFVNPQLVFFGRFEKINVGQQAFDSTPGDFGNVTAYSVGYRWYPIMFSRAGLAWHNEYSISKSVGIVPESGDGTGLPPLPFPNSQNVWSSSVFVGFDFDF